MVASGFSAVNVTEVGAEERIDPLTGDVPVRELACAGDTAIKLNRSTANNVRTERIKPPNSR